MVSLPDKMDYRPCSQAQCDFLHAKPPGDEKIFETLYSGAVGAGKTRALCMKVVMRAMHPGAREGLCRKTVSSLTKSTLVTLLENDGELPPVLPLGSYEYNQQKGRIKLRNGGEIQLFAFDQALSKDDLSMGSYNFTGCGIDEGVELTKEQYLWIMSTRLRLKVKGLWPEAYTATNPGAKSHFLYGHFSIGDPSVRSPYRLVLQTKSHENTYLTATYLTSLDEMDGQFHERYVEGIWGSFEGMIYSCWDDDIHLLEDTPPGICYAGVDEGFTNPFAVVVANLDGTENLHVHDEFYKSGLLQDEKVLICCELAEKHKIDCFYADPSAAGLIEALRNAGLDCMKANHKVNDGIGKVQRRMAVNKKLGMPRLTVHPRCKHLRDEIQGYRWEEGKDKPHKEHDHAVDALRYLVASIDRGGMVNWEKAPPAPARENPEVARLPRYRDVEPEEVEELTLSRDAPGGWDRMLLADSD